MLETDSSVDYILKILCIKSVCSRSSGVWFPDYNPIYCYYGYISVRQVSACSGSCITVWYRRGLSGWFL